MASTKTITINGREYDAATGLPIASAPAARPAAPAAAKTKPAPRPATPVAARPVKRTASPKAAPATARGTDKATAVHSVGPKRSQTLRRTAVQKPAAKTKIVQRPRKAGVRHMDIARSTQVSKFAAHPEGATKKAASVAPKQVVSDIAPKPHPIARKAAAAKVTPRTTPAATVTARTVKEAEVKKAIAAKPAVQSKKQQKETKKRIKKNATPPLWRKRTIIITAAAILALIATFAATHIFPGLSVQVASIRSGVSASYPKYIPDGFSLSQPIKHSDSTIDITFKSNSNADFYTLSQSASSWDSTAVLDNLVKKQATNNSYATTRERGLTIYTYQTSAAWVNGGILYTIEGTAELSGDQIRKIATSL